MADLERIQTHVTALIGANTRALDGTPAYSLAIGDKARSADEIEATCINAAIITAKTVCESDGTPFRTPFLEAMALTHAVPLPFHYGDTSVPTITPYSGASITLKGVSKSHDRIESYRINKNNVYGPTHDAVYQGGASPLAGFYDVVNGIFYFTGYSATMLLAIFDRDDVITKLDDALEPIIISLACGMCAKDGDISDGLFASWYAQGQAGLNEIRGGATVFQPITQALNARGEQTA